MTSHPEVRQPCPELAAEGFTLIHRYPNTGMFTIAVEARAHREELDCYDRCLIVPCLVTPLLTADEAKKLGVQLRSPMKKREPLPIEWFDDELVTPVDEREKLIGGEG